jgi:hypothetical protein
LCASKNVKILDCILYIATFFVRLIIDIINANLQHEEGRMPEMDFVREKVNPRGLGL